MPCYPALALLLGSAMAAGGAWIRRGTYALCAVALASAAVTLTLFVLVRHTPAPGDISAALSPHPGAYKLSLGHMEDLTIESFAYLKAPLLFATAAFLIGGIGAVRSAGTRAFLSAALMMVLFFHAARMAMVAFDPYLASRTLAEALLQAPEGELIIAKPYYQFSSVFFYTNRTALILNGRFNNLEYGSYAPGAANVFIDDGKFKDLWTQPSRYYVLVFDTGVDKLENLVGRENLILVTQSGGKKLFTNRPLAGSASQRGFTHQPVARNDTPGHDETASLGRQLGAAQPCWKRPSAIACATGLFRVESGTEFIAQRAAVFGLGSRIL